MTIEEIKAECQQIQDFLEITTSGDANELVNRLTDLNVYLARSGFLLAEAKRMQEAHTVYIHTMDGAYIKTLSASVAQKFINAKTYEENYLVNWLDRINRTCVHQGDNLRTQISFSKEELKLTRSGY